MTRKLGVPSTINSMLNASSSFLGSSLGNVRKRCFTIRRNLARCNLDDRKFCRVVSRERTSFTSKRDAAWTAASPILTDRPRFSPLEIRETSSRFTIARVHLPCKILLFRSRNLLPPFPKSRFFSTAESIADHHWSRLGVRTQSGQVAR